MQLLHLHLLRCWAALCQSAGKRLPASSGQVEQELLRQAAVAWCHERHSNAGVQVLVKADCKLLHQHYAGLLLPVHSALAGRHSAATLLDALVSDPSAKVRLPNCQPSPEPPAALQTSAAADFAVTHDCMSLAAGPPPTNSCQDSLPVVVPVVPRCATGESSCCHYGGHAGGGCPPTQLPRYCRADKLEAAPAGQVRTGRVACMLQLDLRWGGLSLVKRPA